MEKEEKKEKIVSKKKESAEKEFIKNTVVINPPLKEAPSKTAVFGWGRMNPITTGHEKLVKKIQSVARERKATPLVYLTHSQDKKKNPLSYADKVALAKMAFGKDIIVSTKANTIIKVMQELSKRFDSVVLVVGQDRIKDFETLLNKYNGKDYTFDSIEVVSAGDRDPDAEDVSGMSASKMRAAAAAGQFDKFKQGLPSGLASVAQSVYDMVRSGMKISESVEELDEALTLQQRRQRAITMRKFKAKIANAKKRAMKKPATMEKLKKRARKAAINILRAKLGGEGGKSYGNLSVSQKIMIDKKVEKKKGAIDRIAKKLVPQMKRKEAERRKSTTNEQFNEMFDNPQVEIPVRKRFHQMFNKEGSIKTDRRFRAFRDTGVDERRMTAQQKLDKQAKKHGIGSAERIARIEKLRKDMGKGPKTYSKDELRAMGYTIFEDVNMTDAELLMMIEAYYKQDPYRIKKLKSLTINRKTYQNALATLKDIIARKKKEGNSRHSPEYYAGVVARQYNDVDPRTLANMLEEYGAGDEGTDELVKKYKKDTPFQEVAQDPDVEDEPGTQPKKYYSGLKKKEKESRADHFAKGTKKDDEDPSAYKPAPGDSDAKTKESKHTKKYRQMYGESLKEGPNMDRAKDRIKDLKSTLKSQIDDIKDTARTADTALKNRQTEEYELTEDSKTALKGKAEKSGIPYGILKKVYDRGMAAWRTGHRPGATQEQWAYARVNSFITKGKGTWGGADKDLASKVKKESVNEEVNMKNVDKLKTAARDFSKNKSRNFQSIEDALLTIVSSMRVLNSSNSGRADYKHERIIDKEISRINNISSKAYGTEEGKEIKSLLAKHGLVTNTGSTYRPMMDLIYESINEAVSPAQQAAIAISKRKAKNMKEEDPCWDGYKQLGMKRGKSGKSVPNCVKEVVQNKTIKVGEDAIGAEETHYALVKEREVVAIGNKEDMLSLHREEGGRVWVSTKQVGDLVEEVTQQQINDLEKFADRLLNKFDVDIEFTRHFIDRVNDPRNSPSITVAELQRIFKKIAKNKAKDVKKHGDAEAVLKDMQSDLNLPVVVNFKNGEFEVVSKTIMRKKGFKTTSPTISYD